MKGDVISVAAEVGKVFLSTLTYITISVAGDGMGHETNYSTQLNFNHVLLQPIWGTKVEFWLLAVTRASPTFQ